jgi:RimJ/RimL family protein N-acetyltransferase
LQIWFKWALYGLLLSIVIRALQDCFSPILCTRKNLKGTKQAILFTDNPAAIKAYLAIGFKKIGNYRLALLEKPIKL